MAQGHGSRSLRMKVSATFRNVHGQHCYIIRWMHMGYGQNFSVLSSSNKSLFLLVLLHQLRSIHLSDMTLDIQAHFSVFAWVSCHEFKTQGTQIQIKNIQFIFIVKTLLYSLYDDNQYRDHYHQITINLVYFTPCEHKSKQHSAFDLNVNLCWKSYFFKWL